MKTALYEKHQDLGAKLIDFGGWTMPLFYKGTIHEQRTVRQEVGIFDVSHMGRIFVEGDEAEQLLDLLSTNRISGKPDFSATYTVWCQTSGGCVDDMIIYRCHANKFFLIVNASNRQKDLDHLNKYAQGFKVTITDRYQEDGILAIQGPKASLLMKQIFPEACALKQMHFIEILVRNETVVISATGYTGAGGFEIYASENIIRELWEIFLTNGKAFGIEPVGLGARDILRLEMGYALYGHELDETIAPTESVAAWAVKLSKPAFIGKEALIDLATSLPQRLEQGIVLLDPGVPREGCFVFKNGEKIGKVTSGGFSPTLNKSIAIALLNMKLPLGEHIEVSIRNHMCKAEIVALPFLKKHSPCPTS